VWRTSIEDDAPADDSHHRLDVLDLLRRNRQVVPIEDDEIRGLARLNRTEVVLLEDPTVDDRPGVHGGVHSEVLHAVEMRCGRLAAMRERPLGALLYSAMSG
jgi:hypothetical protein